MPLYNMTHAQACIDTVLVSGTGQLVHLQKGKQEWKGEKLIEQSIEYSNLK